MNEQIKVKEHEIVAKGILGMIASGGGITISFLAQAEAWLRISSLIVGIIVGLVTIISIVRKMK